MIINSKTRREMVPILNENIGNEITASMFDRPKRAQDFLLRLCDKKLIERIGRGKYIVKKEIIADTARKDISVINHKQLREYLNKNIGKEVTTQQFIKPGMAATYFGVLAERGCLERVSWGKYKVLRKVVKKLINRKGQNKNKNVKDLSSIPSILNSDSDGLVMSQIVIAYNNITPESQQVNTNYIYRIFAFAKKNGVVKDNGYNKELRISGTGQFPKRIVLTDPNITLEEWDNLIRSFRNHYQYKQKQTLNKKSTRTKVMNKIHLSQDIITNFNEDRDNENKQFVEDYFINVVKEKLNGELIKCFAITGPDYFRHTTKLINSISKHIMICELKPDIFNVIYKKAQICPSYINGKVSLLNCNVDDISLNDYQYVDLDLMGTISSIKNSILKQIINDSTKLKHILFTASMRNDGGVKNRFNELKELLDTGFNLKLNGFYGGKYFGQGVELFNKPKQLNYCLKHIPDIKQHGRIKELEIFTYQDHTPMLSVLISYI